MCDGIEYFKQFGEDKGFFFMFRFLQDIEVNCKVFEMNIKELVLDRVNLKSFYSKILILEIVIFFMFFFVIKNSLMRQIWEVFGGLNKKLGKWV